MVGKRAYAYCSGAYGFGRVPFTALGTFEAMGQWWKSQIPSDLVVRAQDVDIVEVIFSLIWRGTIV